MEKVFIIILSFVFFGCYNQRKATQQVLKSHQHFPIVGATFCSEEYPCKDVTGSDTVYLPVDSSQFLQTISELNNELLAVYDVQDSLIAALKFDTICKKYEAIILDLRKKNSSLQQQIANIKPIIKTVEIRDTIQDKAAIKALEIVRDQALQIATDKTNEVVSWKKKAKNRFWTLAGIAGVSLLLAGLWVRRKVKGKP